MAATAVAAAACADRAVQQAADVEKGQLLAAVVRVRLGEPVVVGEDGVLADGFRVATGPVAALEIGGFGRHGTAGDLAQLWVDGEADVADEILVAAPVLMEGRAARGCAAAVKRVGGRGAAEFLLLEAAVADKGAEDEGVGRGGGEEDLDRGEEGAVLLAAVAADDVGDAVERDAHNGEAEGEEEHELDLALDLHVAAQEDGDGEDDEHEVGEDVAGGHGDELDVALAALAAGIGEDLPVVVEGPALDEVADDDGDEGGEQGPA